MKKNIKVTAVVLCLVLVGLCLAFVSCDKKDDIEGVYTGVFTVKYAEDTSECKGETTLKLQDGKYSCTGNPNRVPAGGSGSYTISDGKITFFDENFWTADFDWNLILSGEYDYTFAGDNLMIYRGNHGIVTHKYELKKQ